MQRRRRPTMMLVSLFASATAVLSAATPGATLEMRGPDGEARYVGELARAFTPCTIPNDVTPDGIPACSPALSSVCSFQNGQVTLRVRAFDSKTVLDLVVDDLLGPAQCLSGPYTLAVGLRVSGDEPACAGGQCTYQDVVLSLPVDFDPPNDLEIRDAVIEDILAGERSGMHYQILGATITAPDALPMAGIGIGTFGQGTAVVAPIGAGYAVCDAPDTSGPIGPACGPPVWPSSCDSNGGGSLRWGVGKDGNPVLETTLRDLNGPAAGCGDGTYTVSTRLRVTTYCAPTTLCTAVDTTVSMPVTAEHGKIGEVSALVATGPFVTPIVAMEIGAMAIADPSGDLFATAAVSDAWRLAMPKVTLALHDLLDPSDDGLKIDARFPFVDIDPTDNPGVTFTVTDRNGPIYEVTIPGSLWQLGAPIGTRWDFVDKLAGINGVTKASIQLVEKQGFEDPLGFRVKLAARNVDLGAADLPGINLVLSMPKPGGFLTTTAQRNRICRIGGRSRSCK